MTWLARGTTLASFALLALGATIVARTIAAGVGGGLGLLIGGVFMLVGGGRLWLGRR